MEKGLLELKLYLGSYALVSALPLGICQSSDEPTCLTSMVTALPGTQVFLVLTGPRTHNQSWPKPEACEIQAYKTVAFCVRDACVRIEENLAMVSDPLIEHN